jgi:hypothetical protein
MGILTDKPKPGGNRLEQYFADDAATEALALVDSDPDAAKNALLIVADYIQRGEALPGNLADFLVAAIEAAMAKPVELRAKAFTDELGLTANNRRPAGDWLAIGAEVERLVKAGNSEEKAIGALSDETGVSDRTVKRYLDKYRLAAKKFDASFRWNL